MDPNITQGDQANTQPRSVVFIDGGLTQIDILKQGLKTDNVILLNKQTNGIEQITETLEKYTNLDSVHIFSHGSQGQLQLGNILFNQTNLNDYQTELESWQNAFSQDGDLLFYGCNLAAADGFDFVEQISELTQTDAAASTNITGHSSYGDWILEKATGDIEAAIAIDQATQIAYKGQLNIILGTAGNDGLLEGTTGDDTLNGLGGIDSLQGNGGTDVFILGDETGGFYDQDGFNDYADILDFSIGEDTIRLNGVVDDYSFQAVGTSTWIYKGELGNGELVADIFNTNGADITSSIEFIGGNPPTPPNPPTSGNTIVGTAGNDGLLEGTAGDDTLNGLGGIDSLQGNGGADVFILGDETGGFYDQDGFNDYADILDFSIGEDTIRLNGVVDDYSFQTVGTSTWIYKGDFNNGELVADIFNTNGADITSSIEFIGGNPPTPPNPPTSGNTIVGTAGNDGLLEGTAGDDTLNGLGGIDSLQGNGGADVFILGDETGGFYDQDGFNDYADILDFSIGEDTIRLNGVIDDYSFQTVGTSTWIYKGDIANAELVADIFNTNGADITSSIEFVNGSTPTPGEFSLEFSTVTVDEGAASIDLTVNRLGSTQGVASVNYQTSGQTAIALEDFIPVEGTLTFGDGQKSMTIRIPIINDGNVEEDETFAVQLSNPTNGATLGTQRTVVAINDNDQVSGAGTLTFTGPMAMVSESTGLASIRVARVGGSNGTVTVDYTTSHDEAIAGQDYTASAGTLTYVAGVLEQFITVPIIND
ncbi:MAG: DUF4347 domain-containing protein, partial [Leptolyngbya sp. SIO3F4]|nr:DUF4347 domain-containing protein [Leptolyngbya sp. SIO3F4]